MFEFAVLFGEFGFGVDVATNVACFQRFVFFLFVDFQNINVVV